MKLKEYLFDKLPQTIVFILGYIVTILFLRAFKVAKPLILAISFVFGVMYIVIIAIDYLRKQKFYNNLVQTVDGLDKKYLVLEMINKPDFYEGKIFYQTLYEINKSMIENVKEYSLSIADFKEYVEMWIHEVKIPISSLVLLNHNHKNSLDSKYVKQIRKLDNYIEQILYYVRSENAEKDYIIKETSLNDIIKNVALKNKDDLLENNVDLIVDVSDEKVLTDSKWLEFILNQIINNSIKYKRDNIDSYIKIKTYENTNSVKLFVEDNGIGIPKNDLGQVFDKCFTGENGREKSKSTGMGLYIAKMLCVKLGHRIEIESEAWSFTRVVITFGKNDFCKMD